MVNSTFFLLLEQVSLSLPPHPKLCSQPCSIGKFYSITLPMAEAQWTGMRRNMSPAAEGSKETKLDRRLLPRAVLITYYPQMIYFCFRNKQTGIRLRLGNTHTQNQLILISNHNKHGVHIFLVAETDSCSKIHFLCFMSTQWTTFPRILCSKVRSCD